ncbi:hypothetical protein DPMN_097763 [Dreissena polymorpha]|uniref:Uncharacterized protein n=1 Tax=Dreissena polymorpha TaxID=45954 RepID=A0A9D4LCC3_DREPO|nr:hypothetical protein DPMN_097763 [Dreissena polymorpha]
MQLHLTVFCVLLKRLQGHQFRSTNVANRQCEQEAVQKLINDVQPEVHVEPRGFAASEETD